VEIDALDADDDADVDTDALDPEVVPGAGSGSE
jgi:hypothetical protein